MASEQKLYILGHPVAHSKSPAMYNALYSHMGLPWHYDFMDCPEVSRAEKFLLDQDFLSINITTPYKPQAAAAATSLAATAKLAKGANVLVKKDEKLVGYNTDGQGCVAYLLRQGVAISGKTVVVCGTGPTALSIYHAVAQAGASRVVLLSRKAQRSEGVVFEYLELYGKLVETAKTIAGPAASGIDMVRVYDECSFEFGAYDTHTDTISSADIVINATTLGMNEGDPSPVSADLLNDGQVVFDVVYGHGETSIMRDAKAAGAYALDGAGMLVGQAVATVRIIAELVDGEDIQNKLPSDDEMFTIMSRAAEFDLPAPISA